MKILSNQGELKVIEDPRKENLRITLPLEESIELEFIMYCAEQIDIPIFIPLGYILEAAVKDGSHPGDYFYIELIEANQTIGATKNNGSVVAFSEPVMASILMGK